MTKKMNKSSIMTAVIALGLIATVSSGFACWGHGMGHGVKATSGLTVEQQQKLDAVKEKYGSQLDELQASLNNKTAEYNKALANEETTVGTLNRLEAEIADLERQYFALLDQANQEAGLHGSVNHGSWSGCNHRACNHQNHMRPHNCGRHMGSSHQRGMHGKHMARCW